MSNHTQEPWVAGHDDDPVQVGAKSGRFIAMTLPDSDTGQDPTGEDYANAERIAACVNALAGIEDPAAAVRLLREVARAGTDVSFLLGMSGEAQKGELVNIVTHFGRRAAELFKGVAV